MNSKKVIFAVAIIALSCFTSIHSLRCFECSDKYSCEKPSMYECDDRLANNTRQYLNLYHTGVNLTNTGPSYDCFEEYIRFNTVDVHYKGCTYANVDNCKYELNSAMNLTNRYCNQCHNKDGCNPAGRAYVDIMTVFATVIVASAVRYVWH